MGGFSYPRASHGRSDRSRCCRYGQRSGFNDLSGDTRPDCRTSGHEPANARAAATQHNLDVLASRGMLIWGPDSGSQACGDVGPGRMLDPLTIVDMAAAHFSPVNDLQHLNIMITAGPTREPLDPVRYISNHSSGKMGFAIAAAAARRGANVTLVSGPVALPTPPFVQRIDVMTALEMEAAVQAAVQKQHIFIGCAAVADYRAAAVASEKLRNRRRRAMN